MILVANPGSVEEDRAVIALHDPFHGTTVLPMPPTASAARILSECLVRLGKTRYSLPQTATTERYFVDASLWLRAYAIHDLILMNADVVGDDAWSVLETLESSLGLHVWILVDAPQVGTTRLAIGRPVDIADLADLRANVSRAPGIIDAPLPVEQDENAWTREFDRLRSETLNIDAYRVGFVGAIVIPKEDRACLGCLARTLRDTFEEFTDRCCLASAADAAKIAILEFGWHLHIDRERLAGHVGPPTMLQRMRYLEPSRINAFGSPMATAALVLAALELSEREMLHVRRVDVAEDGSRVHVGRDLVDVPVVARPLLRAQLIDGDDHDWPATSPLLGDPGSIGIRALRSMVMTMYDELDIGLTVGELSDRPSRDERWLRDRGLTLRRVDGSRRPARVPGIYDPVETMRMFRASLANDWRKGTVGMEPCSCPNRHVALVSRELSAWPPTPARAKNAASHPWKTARP